MNKNMRNLLIASLIITCQFFFVSSVFAEKIITMTECEYTDEYIEWLNLPSNQKNKTITPPVCKTDESFYKPNLNEKNNSLGDANSEKFDLRDVNGNSYVTPGRSQGNFGNCWAFARIATLESNILVKGLQEQDFSEAHLDIATQNYLLPINRTFSDGGDQIYVSAYLFDRIGPILESEVPYSILTDVKNGTKSKNVIDGYTSKYIVNDWARYGGGETKCSTETIQSAKEYLVTNGALYASMNQNTSDRVKVNDISYFYNSSETSINHAVAVIGWDDTIPASRFSSRTGSTPSRNGGWLIKNSNSIGGTYFYISYDDKAVCQKLGGFYNIEQGSQDNAYVYDKVGIFYYSNINSEGKDQFYLANVFNKKNNGNEKLKKVTFDAYYTGQKYEILYSPSGNLNDFESKYTGTTDHIGNTTVNFNNITITNDKFAIAVKYYAAGENKENRVPAYYKNGEYLLDVEENRSFMSEDGTNWSQYGSPRLGNYYASIKAYTDNIELSTNIYNITYSYDNGVTTIGKTSDSCETDNTSCNVTLPSINAKEGYTVLGWFKNPDGTSKVGNSGEKFTLNENTTLYAVTKQNTTVYTASFFGDNGIESINQNKLSCSTTENNCEISLPTAITKKNYNFAGWYTSEDGGTKIGNNGDKYLISNDVTLYARTSENISKETTYIATFSKDNGINSISSNNESCNTAEDSCEITLPTITVNSGYIILGWYTSESGGEKAGNSGDKYKISNNITLYARATKEDQSIKNNLIIDIKSNPINYSNSEYISDNPKTGNNQIYIFLALIIILLSSTIIIYKKQYNIKNI